MSDVETPLCDAVRLGLWRIFGPGTSPFVQRGADTLVEDVVSKLLPGDSERQRIASAEIGGWFQVHGERRWLASERAAYVATALVEGVGGLSSFEPRAVWSLGAVEASLITAEIRRQWNAAQIDTFLDKVLDQLELACTRDEVLDARRAGYGDAIGTVTRIPKDAVTRKTLLETFDHLERFGHDLVHFAVHRGISNLIEVVLELQPSRLSALVRRLDHPVLQMLAMEIVIHGARRASHRCTLEWLRPDFPDALIALALLETLTTVRTLKNDADAPGKPWAEQHHWSTELRPETDNLEAAATTLLVDMLDALALFEECRALRWLAGAIAYAGASLGGANEAEPSAPVVAFEDAALNRISTIGRRTWTDAHTEALLEGAPGMWHQRILAQLAWALRADAPERAATIAARPVADFADHIEAEMARGFYHLQWQAWMFKDWTASLGLCVALTRGSDHIVAWVRGEAKRLPLTTWAAEERIGAFMAANVVVEHLMLVAWHAIQAAKQLGRPIPTTELHSLAELYWDHCAFVCNYLGDEPQRSVAAECIGRVLVELDALAPSRLLAYADRPGVGPRALYGMLDQGRYVDSLEDATRNAIVEITQPIFAAGEGLGNDTLNQWGQLWLLLEAPAPAQQTALQLVANRLFERDRWSQIVYLKLSILALSHGLEFNTDELYNRFHIVWPSTHTHAGERALRTEIEGAFAKLGVFRARRTPC